MTMQIYVNGVRIEPTSPVTLSVTNGIFAEINQSYSTSFEVVRSGAVDEALRLDRVPYDMLTGMIAPIPCAVQLNSHQLEGRLSVESVTKTHASVTLYITTVEIPQSVLDMYLCELNLPSFLRNNGYYNNDMTGLAAYRSYDTQLSGAVDHASQWYWQFGNINVNAVIGAIETAAGLAANTLPRPSGDNRLLCNSFFIPTNAPAEGYMDLSYNGAQYRSWTLGQSTQAFEFSGGAIITSQVRQNFTAKRDLTNVVVTIRFDYQAGSIDNNQLAVYKVVGGTPTVIGTYTLAGSGTITLNVATLNEGEAISVSKFYIGATDDWQAAIDIQVKGTYNVTTDDYFYPYERLLHSYNDVFRGAHPDTPMMGTVTPTFNYWSVRSGVPKMTVRDFLPYILKLCGMGGTFTRQSTRVIGGIERFEADNDASPSAGVIVRAKANEVVIMELAGNGIGEPVDIDLPIYYADNTIMADAGQPYGTGALVRDFIVDNSDPATYGKYEGAAKAREGCATILSAGSRTMWQDDISALPQSYFADIRDVAGHGTAEVRVTGIPDFVLFPDIIEVNGWVLYVVSTEIDTNSGFYTIKAIIKQ